MRLKSWRSFARPALPLILVAIHVGVLLGGGFRRAVLVVLFRLVVLRLRRDLHFIVKRIFWLLWHGVPLGYFDACRGARAVALIISSQLTFRALAYVVCYLVIRQGSP